MKTTLLTAITALSLAAPALATPQTGPVNLVTNGSFETGDFTGWTATGGRVIYDPVAPDGVHVAVFTTIQHPGTLDQTIATTAGHSYALSFYLAFNGTTPNSANLSFGGADVADSSNLSNFSFTQLTYTVTATSSSSDLAFTFNRGPSGYLIDDIVLTDESTAAEPAMWALMIAGFGLVGGMLRRRPVALAA